MDKDKMIKIYNLALDNSDCGLIEMIKDKYRLEEGIIDDNKYFLLLCYTSNAEEVKKFIEKNNINLKDKI